MSWHPVRAVREAGVSTRGFFLPFDRGRWLCLVVLSFVVGVRWLTPAVLRTIVPTDALPSGLVDTLTASAVVFSRSRALSRTRTASSRVRAAVAADED
jgi:hypothetical protein